MLKNRINYPFWIFLSSLAAVPVCAYILPQYAALPVVIIAGGMWLFEGLKAGKKDDRYVEVPKKIDLAFTAAGIGIWDWNRATGRLKWTPSMEQIYGFAPGSFQGDFDNFIDRVHSDDRSDVQVEIERAIQEKRHYAAEYRIVRRDGSIAWMESRGNLVLERNGEASGLTGIAIDITGRKNLEEAVQFLSLVGQELSGSDDAHAFLKKMAECAVPRFADWCWIDLVDSASGARTRVALVHKDKAKVARAWEMYRRLEENRTAGLDFSAEIIREKKPIIRKITNEFMVELGLGEEHRKYVADMQMKSFMMLPLLTRHGVAGVVTFVAAESGRNYTARELSFAGYLAQHASLAIENGWHYKDLIETRSGLEKKVKERTTLAENRALKLRELTLTLARSEQNERRRIARVLHDDLQQLLVAAKIEIHQLQASGDEEARIVGTKVEQLMADAAEVSRSLTVELSPHVLRDGNLRQVMEWLGRWCLEKHGLHIEVVEYDGVVHVGEDARIFLFQSVKELLLNVVKHAKTRRARVMLASPANGGTVVSVIDYGQGFESGTLDTIGSMFGLFQIRERLEMLRGRLEVDSTPGRGTRISLWLPAEEHRGNEEEAVSAGTVAEAVRGAARKAGRRILIVDDHKIVREGLVNLLSTHSDIAVVGEAGDGMAAIEQALRLQPEVIIMDISMPRMNGIDATLRIKALLPQVKVITLSLHDSQDMEERVRQCGSDAYLNKSGPADQLVETIRGLFSEDGHSSYAKSME